MELDKTTATYCLIVGIMNVALWIVLIISGEVPNVESEIISYVFHWISEFSMAGLNILAGIWILKNVKIKDKLYFFATGMLLTALIGMILYYIVYFEIVFIIMGVIFAILGIILGIKNYEKQSNFVYLVFGILIYSQLNIMGTALLLNDLSLISTNLIAMIPVIILILIGFYKDIEVE